MAAEVLVALAVVAAEVSVVLAEAVRAAAERVVVGDGVRGENGSGKTD